MAEIHLGYIGLILRPTIKDEDDVVVNVSTATTKQIKLEKPDGTQIAKTAAFYTNGSDGIIQYTTIAADIDQVGRWKAQGYIVTPTRTFGTSIHTFDVKGNIYT